MLYDLQAFFFFFFQTQIMYKWIEPKICWEDLTDAIRLPPSGEKKDCPPCNPGFYNNGSSSCHPCPPGTFSDGTKGRMSVGPVIEPLE